MRLLLMQGLRLTFFDEPAAIDNDDERATNVRRRPWAMVMEWRKDEAHNGHRAPVLRKGRKRESIPGSLELDIS